MTNSWDRVRSTRGPTSEVNDQLQILEYIETNTPQGLTDGDRRFRYELEEREKLLARDRSRDQERHL